MKYRYAIWNNPSDYEIFCFRKMWNKIRLLTFAKQIFHSEAISYALAYFTRRRRISLKKKDTLSRVFLFLEVPPRFELGNESFADSCLTTWPRYHMKLGTQRVPNLFLERVTRLVCIFACSENYCSHQCLHWWQQYATGILHLDYSSHRHRIKK